LAVVLDWDIQAMIGGAHAIRWNRAKLWDYLTNAARRRENSLLRDRETSSGAYAASLLIDLLCRDRMRVIDPLRSLWQKAQHVDLSIDSLSEVFGLGTGVALAEALTHPRPVIASTRIDFQKPGGWEIVVRPRA